MIEPSTRIYIADNALIQKVGEEMVILDSQSGQYYTLNDMATDMLERLNHGSSVAELVQQLYAEYEVSEEELASDVKTMISTLVEKQLVKIRGA